MICVLNYKVASPSVSTPIYLGYIDMVWSLREKNWIG